MPRPRLPQQGIRHRVELEPGRRLRLPAATRRHAMQRRMGASTPAVGLEHDALATLQGTAPAPAADILQAPHPTPHARTHPRWSLLLQCFPEALQHGPDAMAREDAFREPLAPWAAPVVHRDWRAAETQRGCPAPRVAISPIFSGGPRTRPSCLRGQQSHAYWRAGGHASTPPRDRHQSVGRHSRPAEGLPAAARCALGEAVVYGRAFSRRPCSQSTPATAGAGARLPSTSPWYYGDGRAIT